MSGRGGALELAAPYLFIVHWSSAYIAIRASLPDVCTAIEVLTNHT